MQMVITAREIFLLVEHSLDRKWIIYKLVVVIVINLEISSSY